MNQLLSWALSRGHGPNFTPDKWTRVVNNQTNVPDFWNGATKNKIIGLKLPDTFGHGLEIDPNNITMLGGMCLLNTVEMKKIFNKEILFKTTNEFADWFSSWYPRFDQVHDAIGVPPGFCRKITYTSEDSFFSHRLSQYTGLNQGDLLTILREIHQKQGHPILKKYLESLGYGGNIELIYTSEIERDLSLSLKIWERMLGSRFRTSDRDFAKVELMYSGFWLDILGLKSGIIYEPANKMILKGWLKLNDWPTIQQYGTNFNYNLGIVGYLPFLRHNGDGSLLAYDELPNYGNFGIYKPKADDLLWEVANMLFMKKQVADNGPTCIAEEKITETISNDLRQYYEI